MPPHIVLPDGRWRFVKRGHRDHRQTNTTLRGGNMARRGRRYYAARRYAHKARSWSGGRKLGSPNMKNVIDGAIVGIANSALPQVLPAQDGLVTLGVGWFRRNPTLTTLGGIQVGAALGSMMAGGLGGIFKSGGGGSQV